MKVRSWMRLPRLSLPHQRKTLERYIRRIFITGLVIFIVPLAVDLVSKSDQSGTTISFDAPATSPFLTELALMKAKIDTNSKTAAGDLVLGINTKQPAADIDLVLFSYLPNSSASIYMDGDPKTDQSDGRIVSLRTGDGFPAGEIRTTFEAPLRTIHKSSYYPFDRYEFDVVVRGCVGSMPCPTAFLSAVKVSAALASQQFVISQRMLSRDQASGVVIKYIVERPFFLRWVSVWIGIFLIATLVYLVRLSDSRDLALKAAGYFGTMWAFRQLIVPPTFDVFPSAIDYCVLILFAVLFFVVSYRAIQYSFQGDNI